jgi:hypothetical protein
MKHRGSVTSKAVLVNRVLRFMTAMSLAICMGIAIATGCHMPATAATATCVSALASPLPAEGPALTDQTSVVLAGSGASFAPPPLPLPLVAGAQEPAETGLTPPLHVTAPAAACPRLVGLVNPALAIPTSSSIRRIEVAWNGTLLPALQPLQSEVVETPHSYGEQLSFFRPLLSLAGIAPGAGTLQVTGYDAAGVVVTRQDLPGLEVATPAAPPTECQVPAAHPRIWLTPARLANIRARDPVSDPAAARFFSHRDGVDYFLDALAQNPDVLSVSFANAVYEPESYIPALALCYQLARGSNAKRASLCASATKTLSLHIAQEYDTGVRSFARDSGYDIRFGLLELMLAYDWIYDELSESNRALLLRVANAWVDWYAQNGYSRSLPYENYYAGWLQGLALTAVATAHENPHAGQLFALLDERLRWEVPVLNQRLCGGDWPEGWNYGPLSVQEMALVATLLRDIGADPGPLFDFLEAEPRWLTYQMAPDYSQLVSFGGYSGNLPHKTSPALLAVLSSMTKEGALAARLYTSGLVAPVNDFSDGTRGFTAFEMIFASTGQLANPDALPLSFLAVGTGRFLSKSSLTDPAGYQASAEGMSYYHDHYGYANGDVRLYRGGTCLVCPSAYRGNSFRGEDGTTAFSTYLVNGRGQADRTRNNQILFALEAGTFSALGMRFESSYAVAPYEEGLIADANPLDYLIREMVHVRPGTLIVRDLHRRRRATDALAARFHLGPAGPAQQLGPGSYRLGTLGVQLFGSVAVAPQFSADTDASGAVIGSLLEQQLPASTNPIELVAVFSEQLQATGYAGGVLTLSNGQCVRFAGGAVSMSACP